MANAGKLHFTISHLSRVNLHDDSRQAPPWDLDLVRPPSKPRSDPPSDEKHQPEQHPRLSHIARSHPRNPKPSAQYKKDPLPTIRLSSLTSLLHLLQIQRVCSSIRTVRVYPGSLLPNPSIIRRRSSQQSKWTTFWNWDWRCVIKL